MWLVSAHPHTSSSLPQAQCVCHNMDSGTDYRRLAHPRMGLFFTGDDRQAALMAAFSELTHTSEVAPGASSAPLSSLLDKSLEQQEDGAQVQTKQEGITAGWVEDKPAEVSKKLWDDQAVSAGRAILSNYRKEIKGLSKQLHKQTAKVVELERIAENRPEELQRVVKMRNGHSFALHGFHPRTGRPLSKKEYDDLASDKTGGIMLSLVFITIAFFVGLWKGQADAAKPSKTILGGSNAQPKSKADEIVGGSEGMGSGAQSGALDNSWSSLLWKKQ